MTDILIIDDDERYGLLLMERFEMTRWRAQFHRGPDGTLSVLSAVCPRLALIHLAMRGLDDGLLLDFVRNTAALARLRLIFYGASDLDEQYEHAGHHFLSKSARRSVFMAKVTELMSL